eukprot:Phypoly_transcript_17257.p1 GENE.Phypoly_transcript_17257~~Phypoly_transcript_17257.p1  ORF type:complete len:223 (+),score=34.75 Phypoly_transcript_17257:70-738(+)
MSVEEFAKNVAHIDWIDPIKTNIGKEVEKEDHFKIVLVGDGAIGKTSLLQVFYTKKFPEEYIPTVLDLQFGQFKTQDGHTYSISLWDTSSREDYDRLRPLSYHSVRVFFACFCVINVNSLERAKSVFIPEMRHHMPGIPIILVGTKTDLREDKETLKYYKERNLKMVSYTEGEEVAKFCKVAKYMECSALKQSGVDALFETAIKIAATVPVPKRDKSKCALL